MDTPERACVTCGSPLPAHTGPGRPRLYCDGCQPTSHKADLHVLDPREAALARLEHAGQSEAILSVVAADLAEQLIGWQPWLLETDRVGIEQYCRNEGISRIIFSTIMEIIEKPGRNGGVRGVPQTLWKALNDAETRAMRGAEALGLTPMGRMKIAKDMGLAQHFGPGAASVRERGRQVRLGEGA